MAMMPTKEQLQEYAIGSWEVVKANAMTLNSAGLFKLDHVIAFSKDLATPIDQKYLAISMIQATLLARIHDLKDGFTVMNATVFFLEVMGSLAAWLLGRSLILFIFEILLALCVAYVLYWLVIHAEGNDYKLVAIGLYVIYSIINMVQAVTTLVLIVPPIFFFLKTIASLSCAFYAFKIEKMISGSTILDGGTELGVAE